MVDLFVLYPKHARVVLSHYVAVISYVPLVRMLLVPQTYVLPGSNEIPLPKGFRLQVGLDEFFHLARDVGVHLSRIFQKPFHVVVYVVSGDAGYDLWNSLGLHEVFPAYSTDVGDDTRGQNGGKVWIILIHGYLRDVFGGATPGGFQSFEVTKKTFPFIDEDPKFSNVVRQRARVQNQGLDSAVRTPYSGLPIQLVRVKLFEKVSRDLEETPLFVPVFCESFYKIPGLRQVRVEDKVLQIRAGILPLKGKSFAGNAGFVVSPGLFQVATEVTLREFLKAHILSYPS